MYQTYAQPSKTKLSIALGLFIATGSVIAQEKDVETEDYAEMEEVVITAQKREQAIQEIPISIASFDAEDLENKVIEQVESLSTSVPNLVIGGEHSFGGETSGKAYIRGLPGVGIYIDDVYQDSGIGLLTRDLVEVERVNVLRGPQGTLFGKETTGGAIQIYTKKPGDSFKGVVKYGIGTGNLSDFNFAVDLPISDSLRTRISGSSVDRDGYIENVAGDPDGGDINTQSINFDVVWEPNDTFSARFKYGENDFTQDSMARILIDQSHLDDFESEVSGYADTYWQDSDETSLNINWDINENISIKSITGYNEQSTNYWIDYDGRQDVVYESSSRDYEETISQELQVLGDYENLFWVAGVYYQESDYKSVNHTKAFWAPPSGYIEGGLGGDNIETEAVFADITYNITEKLALSFGARYSDETATNIDYQPITGVNDSFIEPVDFSSLSTNTILADQGVTGETVAEYSNTSVKLSATYQYSNDIMLYATYSEGFTAGGAESITTDWDNDPNTAETTRVLDYDPEQVASYETGIRSEWLDGRLTVNASLFFINYDDIQLRENLLRDDGTFVLGRQTTNNAATAEVQGIELDVTYHVTDSLSAQFSYGLTDSKYKDVGNATELKVNSEFQKAPENSYNISMSHYSDIFNSGSINTNITYGWKDEQRMAQADGAAFNQDSFGLLSGRISFTPNSGKWSLAAYGSNLTDELYYLSVHNSAGLGGLTAAAGKGREFGLEIKMEFE